MKILIAVVNCHHFSDRREKIRQTWAKQVGAWYGIDLRFFVGNPSGSPEPDVVYLDCGDDYLSLPSKAKGVYKYAMDNNYDYTFKIDDDCEVYVNRLLSEDLTHDFIGRMNYCWGGFCSGGPGFWLSRRAAEIIANQPLSNDTADDRWIGQVLAAYGIKPLDKPNRYVLDTDSYDSNTVATICRVKDAPLKPEPPLPEPIVVINK